MKKLLIASEFLPYEHLINNRFEYDFVMKFNFDTAIKNNDYDAFILSDCFVNDLFKIRREKKFINSFIVTVQKNDNFSLVSDYFVKETLNEDIFNNILDIVYGNNAIQTEASISYYLKKILAEKDSDVNSQIYRIPYLTKFLVDLVKGHYDELQYSNEYFSEIIDYSIFHDLGKLCIEDNIVNSTTSYTDKERDRMKEHSKLGFELYSVISSVFKGFKSDVAANMILYHHEKYDGTGYPNNIKGEDIPLEARIIAIVDVYDALRSKRKYKSAFSHEEAIQILEKEKGKHFDPSLISLVLKNERDLEEFYNTLI